MGQKGRDRTQRRRGFDDEDKSGSSAYGGRLWQASRISPNASPSGPAIDAVVKWFNADKGFGFVELADRSGDAFLHAAVLEAAGHTRVDPGSKLSVQVGVGQKGRQVTSVLAVDASTGVPRLRTHGPQRRRHPAGNLLRPQPALKAP